uniref:Mutator-like transposase domain-containing protein n=1 Tax=Schizaphis graminum TaxID=13262 RepID=A0A2S2P2G9_SCHGA
MKRLREANPYGPNIVIKKIECTNHLLRNYINKLRDISNKRKNSKGECVPGCYRKILHDRLLRLRYAVTEAIKYRQRQLGTIPYEDNLLKLKKDIINGPSHVFGDHSDCSQYFYEGPKIGKQYFS